MAIRGITFSKQTVSSNDDKTVNIGYTDGCPLTFSFKKEDDAVNKIQHIPSNKE